MKVPKSLYLSKRDCDLATIDVNGRRKRFTEEQMGLNLYFNLQCMLNGHAKMVELIYPKILVTYDDPKYVDRAIEIAKEAEKMKVKLLPFNEKTDKVGGEHVAFISDKDRIKALTYKYFEEKIDVEKFDKKGIYTMLPYIMGVLFNYKPEEIRGYYLRLYLLKNLPDKFKEPLEEIEESNGDKFVQPDQFYDRRYDYVKKVDNFAHFDSQFRKTEREALQKLKKVSDSEEFKRFCKKHIKDIVPFKYNKKLMFPPEDD